MTSYLDGARKASPLVQVRGKSYFQNGQVRLLSFDGGHAEFESYGTETYHVNLYFDGKKLSSYSCTCPYGQGMCKHVVASLYLLESQAKGELSSLARPSEGPTATIRAYEAYFAELRASGREPMAYDVRRLGTKNLGPDDIEAVLTGALELTLANSSSYGGETGFYDNLVRLLEVDESTTGARCLGEALARLKAVAFRPLFRLFLRESPAAGIGYQKAAMPFLGKFEVKTTGIYGRMSLEIDELRRLSGAVLPLAARCYPGSSLLSLKEARKRHLFQETKAIFLDLLGEGTFDYDAYLFLAPNLEEKEKKDILRNALLRQGDFQGYVRIRSLLGEEDIQAFYQKLSEHAQAAGYGPAFDFYEEGNSKRGTLASVEVEDLVLALPRLPRDVHERAIKRIITRIETELNKKSDVKEKLVPLVRALALSHSPLLTHYLNDPRMEKAAAHSPQIEGALAFVCLALKQGDAHSIRPYGGNRDVSS